MEDEYQGLHLENQLCFPLYAASREVIKQYRPMLDELNLTYTQYITLMVLWDKQVLSVKELGKILYLDSGTLTPLLKSLESKGFVTRSRSRSDERVLLVELTPAGLALRDRAKGIPGQMGACVRLSPEEAMTMYRLLYKLLDGFSGVK